MIAQYDQKAVQISHHSLELSVLGHLLGIIEVLASRTRVSTSSGTYDV